MTIAAGFRFDGGVFLCADSQFTYGGAVKTKGDKLMSGAFEKIPVKIAFTLAGDVPKARAAIRNILVDIDSLSSGASAIEVFSAIEHAMERSYRTVFNHPTYDPKTQSGPHFWLLIALWMEGRKCVLLKTEEETVTEVPQFDCSGSGEYLFRYILSDVYTPDMGLQQVITLAIYAMKEIKAYDTGVGFNSEFIAFFDQLKSFSKVAGYDVDHMENFGSLTKREYFKYMLVMADLRSTDEQTAKAKQLFEDNLVNLRKRYAEDKNHRKNMQKLLDILATADDAGITFALPIRLSISRKSTGRR